MARAASTHRINLTKIEGDGDFPCPRCGTLISPDDESETIYSILDTIIGDDDLPESMTIKCNKCKSIITLEGLDELPDEEPSRAEISEALPESKLGYRTSHNIVLDGENIGRVDVEYAQEEDVEAFKKLRDLHIGDPFKATVIITKTQKTLEREDYKEIAKATKRKIKNLKENDTYIIEFKNGQKTIKGRATNL